VGSPQRKPIVSYFCTRYAYRKDLMAWWASIGAASAVQATGRWKVQFVRRMGENKLASAISKGKRIGN